MKKEKFSILSVSGLLRIYFIILVFMESESLYSQDEAKIFHRVYLTANTVDISSHSSFIPAVQKLLSGTEEPFSFIINGDLIEGKFSKKKSEKITQNLRKLFEQLTQFEKGQIVVIPGDRDWADSGKDGWEDVKKLEKLIKSFDYDNVKWALKKGCPGPKIIELTQGIYLAVINTQWWNHPYEKPGPADADCKISTTDDFKEELEDIMDDETSRNLIIAGHFPVISLGEYGGHFSLRSHLFPFTELIDWFYLPLPIIGSYYPSYRKNVGTNKDISNENFNNFRKLMGNIISHHHSLVYVSGHEHNLQILKKETNYFINSGSPDKPGYTVGDSDALYSESVSGLIELIYYDNGKVATKVHVLNNTEALQTDEQFVLYQSAIDVNDSDIPVNELFIPNRKSVSASTSMSETHPDSVKVIAGEEYSAGWFHRLFFGDHYRTSWTAPVEVPVLNPDTTFGGLVPLKKGGGRQTKSLKFTAGNGKRYVFRSVNKDPIKALDYELRETIVADVVRDQTTTQQPYGAMAADIMMNELDVLHAHPKLYVLPDDDKLGPYKKDYGNMLGMLEENPTNPDKDEKGFAGADAILRSHKFFRKLYQDHKNQVDTENFAIARCFDILVGDWGKHEDNWKWAGFDKGDYTVYKPMPRDRDHVFSNWDGILPWLADREWAKPSGENFDYEIVGLRSLMWQARHLDRFVASDLDKTDWIRAANFVQDKITDEVIERAVRNMPEEIYDLSGKEIENKLKQRVRDLDKYAVEYYEMLAGEVDVVGSNKKEYFKVIRKTDGTVQVTVANLVDGKEEGTYRFYDRTFHPDETDEIRLYGLDGADVFDISGKSSESILVRVIGGPGKDKIYDKSTGDKTLIYETNKKAVIKMGDESVRMSPSDKTLYNYNRTSFAYNTYFLLPYIAYNVDEQFILGLGVEFLTQRFGKKDYSTKHNISGKVSTGETFSLGYDFRMHHLLGYWDLELGGFYANPTDFQYFYGIGNETVKDQDLFNQDYYKMRYKSFSFKGGMFHDFWKQSSFSGLLRYENNEGQLDKQETILADTTYFGEDKVNLAEIDMRLDFDFRDDPNLPTDGMRFYLSHNNGFILNNDNSNYGKTLAFLEYFVSVRPFTLGIKTGGGSSYGDIPFYNLFSLGQNTYLRGYRNNRFTGESMAFFNSELRLQFFDLKTVLVPIRVGITGFFDAGQIFQSGEDSDKWHTGYGFGIYVVPLEARYTLNLSAGFSEEESLLITFGLGGAF